MGRRTCFVRVGCALAVALSSCGVASDGDGDGDAGLGDADLGVEADGTPGGGDAGARGDADARLEGPDGDASDCYATIDLVFVIDVSSSMAVLIRALESQLGTVWRTAAEHDSEPRFGLTVFVDDVVVEDEGRAFDSTEALQARLRSWAEHTTTNQQADRERANTDWPENSLDALSAAATSFDWRDQATTLRLVIFATDDSFLEHPYSFSSGIQVEHTYEETVALLQERSIRVAAFAAHMGGAYDGVDVSSGFFAPYEEQPAIPEATSGRAFEITEVGRSISLADAIVTFMEEELCEEYVVY